MFSKCLLIRHPGHLTEDQQQKLDAFRKQLQDAGYTERMDDPSLVRSPYYSHRLTIPSSVSYAPANSMLQRHS